MQNFIVIDLVEVFHHGIEPSLFDQLGINDYSRSANFLRYSYIHILLDNNYYPMVMPFGEGENGL